MQKIPSVLVKILIPLLTKQLDDIATLVDSIANKVLALPASLNMKCSDPRIEDIKNDLKKLNQLIDALSKSFEGIDKILALLKKIGQLAQIFKLVGLGIPAIPGVPTGVATTIITTFTAVGANCLSAVECLQGLLGSLQAGTGRITDVISKATNTIGSICNNELFNVTADTKQQMQSLDNLNLGNSAKLSSINFNLGFHDQSSTGPYFTGNASVNDGFSNDSAGIYSNTNFNYVSEFYNEHNVSDDDINTALKLINDLYTEQKAAINKILSDQAIMSAKDRGLYSNFNKMDPGTPESRALLLYQEAPSQVYYGKSIGIGTDNYVYPSLTGTGDDIFTGGKQNDFFIDLENKVIFGPKETDTVWGQPIKY